MIHILKSINFIVIFYQIYVLKKTVLSYTVAVDTKNAPNDQLDTDKSIAAGDNKEWIWHHNIIKGFCFKI